MNGKVELTRIALVALVLVAASACGSQPSAETSAPPLPEATNTAAPAATTVPEPTATTVPPTATVPPTPAPDPSARYRLTFEAAWSEETHPTDFPPNPHFSGLIGATHREGVSLWEVGETATPGIKNMAETGGKSPLDTEIQALIADGGACELVSGGGIPLSPGSVTVEFTASLECPLVSVVSMIAPSPDWFVGVTGLGLLREGVWVEELVVDLYPWDAGTDSGSGYTSPDAPTEVREGIYQIEGSPFLVEGQVTPLGVFRFTLLNE